jgi:transposase
MSYSLDFRIRLFEIQEKEGLTFEETSKGFGVPIRTLFRWKNRLEPCTTRNKPATKIDMEALKKHVQEYPDAYQYERAAVFGVSQGCIFFALKRLSISYKKNAVSSQGKPSEKN